MAPLIFNFGINKSVWTASRFFGFTAMKMPAVLTEQEAQWNSYSVRTLWRKGIFCPCRVSK
jgi:hypothetical protein